MTELPRPPHFASDAVRDGVRALLADVGYTEPAFVRALGPHAMSLPRDRSAVELVFRTAPRTPQAVLARLFLIGAPVSREETLDALGARGLEALRAAGLLALDDRGFAATAGLTPLDERVFAHDRRDAHRAGAADYVVGVGPATRHSLQFAVQRPVASTLDLGCGQGVLGIVAASHSGQVTCADLNRRALAFCAFNAALNGTDRVRCAQGDLFQAVPGQRFDLIVCNPPYVISPASTFVYRDGGGGICERIARETRAHLNDGGLLQMACNWPHRRGRDWRADLAKWFEGSGCDAWVLATGRLDAASYAGVWLRQQHEDVEALDVEFDRWMEFYEREGIESVSSGVVMMRKAAGRAPWFELRAMPPAQGACGESIARTFEARDYLATLGDDAALLDARLRLSPDAVATMNESSDGSGWTRMSTELRLARGLGFAARVDPVAAELAGYFDGARTAREAAAAFAAANALALEPLLPQLPKLVRQLAQLGLLLPATDRPRLQPVFSTSAKASAAGSGSPRAPAR